MQLDIRSLAGIAGLLLVQQLSGAVEPKAGTWKTWVLPNGAVHRLQRPPGDEDTRNELAQLKKTIDGRDAGDLAQINYWNSGAPAYRWIQIAQQEVNNHGLGGPAATRAISLVAAALNDAMVAAWDTKYAYNRPRPAMWDSTVMTAIPTPDSPSYPSEHLTAAGAAAGVLSYLFPDRKAAFDQMVADDSDSRQYAGTEFPSDISAGVMLGQAVAADVVAYARADRSDTKFTGSFPPKPGVWSSANPSFPLAGTWMPWALPTGGELRLDPPPPLDGQLQNIKQFTRTVDTNRTAFVWEASFIDPWVDTVNRFLYESRLADDAPKAAQVYALAMLAQHDATIACWDTKYAYLEQRPPQADPTFTTLIPIPQHPSYPSGHACASGAAAAVMSAVFPDDKQYFLDHAKEGGLSTFYSGIHFSNDVDAGLKLGAGVAHFVLQRAGLPDVVTPDQAGINAH